MGAVAFRLRWVTLGILSLNMLLYAAKTPQQLKSEFQTLLGSGRYARIVWQKDNGYGWPGLGSGSSVIEALDTKDGVIGDLVPNQPSGYMMRPSLTWNGARVVFTDSKSAKLYVVNWDGTGLKTLVTGYANGNCWKGEGKHWVLANKIGSGGAGAMYKINIDDPREIVQLTSHAGIWPSMSPDGKYLAALYPGFGHAGVVELATGNLKKFTNPAGCWPTIARDETHDVLYTIEPHIDIRIVDPTEKEIRKVNVFKPLPKLPGCEEYNILRWTPDRNFLTLYMDQDGGQNPFIVNITNASSVKYVSLNDQVSSAEGNCDVFFYSGSVDVIKNRSVLSNGNSKTGTSSARIYNGIGQKIDISKTDLPGIYLHKDHDGSTTRYFNARSRTRQ